jgi:hypothetical protein
MLAANALLKDLDDLKLPQQEIRKLGDAEFSRLMGALDVALTSLLEAVKIESTKVAQHKASQKEKYNLGKDQANASWTSTLPAFNNAVAERNENLSAVQELDDVPEVISHPAKVTITPLAIQDTLRIIKPEDEVKGVFVKTGDPKPITPVVSDKLPPRKRLILDEDEVV